MTIMTDATRTRPALDGVLHMAPAAAGIIPFATLIGVAITESPLSDPVGFIAGLVIAGGSAHLAVVGSAGSAAFLSVLTALMINARGLIYGATLAPAMRDQPRWFRWVAAYGLVDQVFAVVSPVLDRGDRYVRLHYLGAMGTIWTVYMTGVGIGIALGPVVPRSWPLGLAVPIVFVALLAPGVRGRPAAVATVVALSVSVLAAPLPAGLGLIAAICAGTVAGAVADRNGGTS